MSRLHSRRFREMGRHDKPTYFGQLLVEAASDASGDIPYSIYQPKWPNLQSLAFTSQLLHPTTERDSINDLLQAAAGAAMEMPKLQTMEIWNGESGLACIFLYRRAGAERCPTSTLSSTWGHSLDSRVLKAWDDMVNRHSTCKVLVLVRARALAGEDFKSHGSVVGVLELRRLVLHQVSSCQVRWEAENC